MYKHCDDTEDKEVVVSIVAHTCMCAPSVQYGDGKKRRKPNYSSVDLSEVEWEDKDDMVRCSPLNIYHRLLALDAFICILCLLATKRHGEQEDWDLLHGGEEERR